MKGFKLDLSGDTVIENGLIQYAEDDELLRKTVEMVVGTNKGEWWLDEREGINFRAIITKNPDYDLIRSEIAAALILVDRTFAVTKFDHTLTGRSLHIKFEAMNREGRLIRAAVTYS